MMTTELAGTFDTWFRARFGRDFPIAFGVALERRDDDAGDVFTSPEAKTHPELTTHKLMTPYVPSAPSAFVVAGAWGFGASRQAFYLVTRESIASGGTFDVYIRISANIAFDDDVEANALAFFEGYRDWRALVGPALREGRISYSMGYGELDVWLEGERGRVRLAVNMPLAENGAVLRAAELWLRLLARSREALG